MKYTLKETPTFKVEVEAPSRYEKPTEMWITRKSDGAYDHFARGDLRIGPDWSGICSDTPERLDAFLTETIDRADRLGWLQQAELL